MPFQTLIEALSPILCLRLFVHTKVGFGDWPISMYSQFINQGNKMSRVNFILRILMALSTFATGRSRWHDIDLTRVEQGEEARQYGREVCEPANGLVGKVHPVFLYGLKVRAYHPPSEPTMEHQVSCERSPRPRERWNPRIKRKVLEQGGYRPHPGGECEGSLCTRENGCNR